MAANWQKHNMAATGMLQAPQLVESHYAWRTTVYVGLEQLFG